LGHTKYRAVIGSYSSSIADDNNLEACLDNSNMKFYSYADCDDDGHDCYSIALGGYVEELMDKRFPGLKGNILTWLAILLGDALKKQEIVKVNLGPMGKKMPFYLRKVM
jgi:hypothetical protein